MFINNTYYKQNDSEHWGNRSQVSVFTAPSRKSRKTRWDNGILWEEYNRRPISTVICWRKVILMLNSADSDSDSDMQSHWNLAWQEAHHWPKSSQTVIVWHCTMPATETSTSTSSPCYSRIHPPKKTCDSSFFSSSL